jgi:hypothetical protein
VIYPGDYYEDDLEYLAQHSENKNVKIFIEAFIAEIAESQGATWCLMQWKGDNKNPFFNVSAINHLQNKGYNLYRLRPLGSSHINRYRVIYAYDNQYDSFYLLAVVEKPPEHEKGNIVHDRIYNYEEDHAIIKRVCDEYDELDIPKLQ